MSASLASLELAASRLLVSKYISTSMGVLVMYDYLLTLEDEIRYVWKGRKSWSSALFIVDRYSFLAYATLVESSNSASQYRLSRCVGNAYTTSILSVFLFFVSDLFIFLRVFAVSGRNKFVGWYLPTLVCAKLVASFITVARLRLSATPLPDLPLDEFKVCAITTPFDLQIIPSVIAAVFNISAFLLILWFAYSNAVNLRLPVLLRTIVADATVYFIVAACVHAAVLLFLVLGDSSINELPSIIDAVITPVLVNRLVLSLKKAADIRNRSVEVWNAGRLTEWEGPETTVSHHPTGSRMGISRHRDIPLNLLTRHGEHVESSA